MAPAQHLEPTATAAPDPVLTCHDAASTATHHGIPRTRETAPRGPRRGLRAIIAISRCDPPPGSRHDHHHVTMSFLKKPEPVKMNADVWQKKPWQTGAGTGQPYKNSDIVIDERTFIRVE